MFNLSPQDDDTIIEDAPTSFINTIVFVCYFVSTLLRYLEKVK
jgi:hypothetical protein